MLGSSTRCAVPFCKAPGSMIELCMLTERCLSVVGRSGQCGVSIFPARVRHVRWVRGARDAKSTATGVGSIRGVKRESWRRLVKGRSKGAAPMEILMAAAK